MAATAISAAWRPVVATTATVERRSVADNAARLQRRAAGNTARSGAGTQRDRRATGLGRRSSLHCRSGMAVGSPERAHSGSGRSTCCGVGTTVGTAPPERKGGRNGGWVDGARTAAAADRSTTGPAVGPPERGTGTVSATMPERTGGRVAGARAAKEDRNFLIDTLTRTYPGVYGLFLSVSR